MAQLDLDRCPHCGVDKPTLSHQNNFATEDYLKSTKRHWAVYSCQRCGGVVVASAQQMNARVQEIYPTPAEIHAAIPERPGEFLRQTLSSGNAPAGAIMLAASSVDSMLKAKGYQEGSLYNRIEKAAADHLITREMAKWAHEVRLEANDQRHADENAPLPTFEESRRVIEFAEALAQFLFVLPARVQSGLNEVKA
jgi:hypothetical protein